MKETESITGEVDRRILLGMLTSTVTVTHLAAVWPEGGAFDSDELNLLATRAVRFFNKHGRPIREGIFDNVVAWADSHPNRATTAELMERIIAPWQNGGMKKECAGLVPEQILDQAQERWTYIRLSQLNAKLAKKLEIGHYREAEELLPAYSPLAIADARATGMDVLSDKERILNVFKTAANRNLIQFDGAVGQFFQHALERDAFVVVQGTEKSGKSWILLHLAWEAMLQRKRVAYFGAGDLSEDQVMERVVVKAAQIPIRCPNHDNQWPATINWPTSIKKPPETDRTAPADITCTSRVIAQPLDGRTAWAACQDVQLNQVGSKDSYFRLEVRPNSTLSVEEIRSILRLWKLKGWTPDVLVIDYMDILDMVSTHKDYRHQINATWQQVRRLTQEFHCLVISATQADAEAYDRRTMSRRNFSEDHRKNAHVSGMIGLNQAEDEKALDIRRLNWLEKRGAAFDSKRELHIAGCLAVANPMVVGVW